MVAPRTSLPTLTRSVRAYGLAILIVYGLSSFSLASELHQRLVARRRSVSVFAVYCALLAATALCGAVTVGVADLAPGSVLAWVASVPVGVAAGAAALRCDRAVMQRARRRRRGRAVRDAGPGRPRRLDAPRVAAPAWSGRRGARRSVGTHRFTRDLRFEGDAATTSTGVMAAVAVLEELIFRGFLLVVCLRLPDGLTALAILGLVTAFALSHIWFGWPQVVAKLPLGVIATACVLVVGGVVVAVVTHVVFNLKITARLQLIPRSGAPG